LVKRNFDIKYIHISEHYGAGSSTVLLSCIKNI